MPVNHTNRSRGSLRLGCRLDLEPATTRKRRTRPLQAAQRRMQLCAMTLAVLLYPAAVIPSRAQASPSDEYQIKAAFLFHFAQFVEWPEGAFKDGTSALTYCTVGVDPFRGALDESLRAKMIGEHGIRVEHLKQVDAVHDCQILFIGAAQSKNAASILASVKGDPVLTVGETPHFAEDGGMIGFCLEGNKIRFEINARAVSAAKLKMSARLLTLAKTVIGTAGVD
jgi:YfiR/HmsC-like